MDLSAVVRRYAAEGTGQLVLKFAETPHLCKIAIEDGEAVYIRLGLLDPQQTLEFILGKTPLEASFIKGCVHGTALMLPLLLPCCNRVVARQRQQKRRPAPRPAAAES